MANIFMKGLLKLDFAHIWNTKIERKECESVQVTNCAMFFECGNDTFSCSFNNPEEMIAFCENHNFPYKDFREQINPEPPK